jgi:hypothetical protein
MKTLEEIKALVYPTENVDWAGVLKDLLSQKTKNGELVTFNRIYLYDIGDPDLYVCGVSLVNGNLIIAADMVYGGDTDASFIGPLSDEFSCEKGIRLTDNAIKEICKAIFEGKYKVDFDFSSMKGIGCYYFCGDYLEEELDVKRAGGKTTKEIICDFINGKDKGYIEV